MQRNSVLPPPPGAVQASGSQYAAAAGNNDSGSKQRKHKFSKSREFYGSTAVNQINLNSSISSKTS